MIGHKHERLARFVVAVCSCLTLIATASPLAARPASTGKHCVWRVTNVPVPFYLVGSIHNLRGDDYPLADVYRKALADSERLLFEFNPKERNLVAQKFRAVAKYPEGQDIRGKIRPETLASLINNLRRSYIRFDDVKQYKPWAIALRLLSLRQTSAGNRARSLDNYFAYHAQRLGKEVGGLETAEEHVAFWGNMWDLDGERLLATTLARGAGVTELFDDTHVAWQQGNVRALSATRASLRDKNSRVAQRLFDHRYAKWLPRIQAEMKSGKPTGIVAGAIHFSGPNSVVDSLQKRGYKIEQL